MADPRKFATKLAKSLKRSDAAVKSPPAVKTYLAGDSLKQPTVQKSKPAELKPAKL